MLYGYLGSLLFSWQPSVWETIREARYSKLVGLSSQTAASKRTPNFSYGTIAFGYSRV